MLECDICEYETVHSSNLTTHMRKHTDNMLKCDVCDYKTTQSSN